MCRLPQRVHAGVGAARAFEFQRAFCHFSQRPQQEVLHGIAAGLRLPSIVGATVVGEREFQSHGLSLNYRGPEHLPIAKCIPRGSVGLHPLHNVCHVLGGEAELIGVEHE